MQKAEMSGILREHHQQDTGSWHPRSTFDKETALKSEHPKVLDFFFSGDQVASSLSFRTCNQRNCKKLACTRKFSLNAIS